ncbi:MAG: TonB-dependent receptor [Caulobacteraceae bacterium]|nr:TonB-dependent receptor [Caulobacteraceae bacterium]
MTNSFARRAALMGSTSLGLAASLVLASAASAQSAKAAQDSGAEIVVTAQKRAQSVQKVPISVSAFTEQRLERSGVENVSDLARIAPGLAVSSAGPGQNVLIVRGISSTAGSAGTVGYYLDDTPISASSNASLLAQRGLLDPSLFDLSRVEVLRGPQGTLYGSSSMGGTIKYITNQPEMNNYHVKLSGTVSGTEGGGPNASASGVVNIPLVQDKVAARVTAFYRYQGGYIDRYQIDPNNYLAVKPNSTVKRDVNTENTEGFRAQLRIQPDDSLSITPSIFYQYTRLGAPFQFDEGPGTFHNLIQTRDVSEVSDQRSVLGNVAIHKSFPKFEITSSTSYYDRKVIINEDVSKVLDYFYGPDGLIKANAQSYAYPAVMTGNYENKEFTQELRFTSKFNGPLQFIGGLYFHRTFAPLESAIPVPPGYNTAFESPFGDSTIYHGVRKATLQETAGFGEATLQLGYGFAATAGFRAFDVDQRFFQEGDGVLNGGHSLTPYTHSSDQGVNPKFNLSWQIDPDHMVYLTAAKGYRPGGPNNPAPPNVCGAEVQGLGLSDSQLSRYNPDSLWNYEAGAKTTWLDHKLTINGSVYYIDWSDVQQQLDLKCGYNITANFGKAVSKGAELEVDLRPIEGLRLSAGVGYTNATLSNDVPGPDKDHPTARKGDWLLDVPHVNGSVSAEYTRPIVDDYSGFGRVDVSYVSTSHALYDRSSPYYRRGDYSITNLRLGVEKGAAWEAVLFVDNLFDKIGETGLPVAIGADLPTTRRIATTRPRTVGLTLNYKY